MGSWASLAACTQALIGMGWGGSWSALRRAGDLLGTVLREEGGVAARGSCRKVRGVLKMFLESGWDGVCVVCSEVPWLQNGEAWGTNPHFDATRRGSGVFACPKGVCVV